MPTSSWQRALFLPLIVLAWLAVLVVVGWLLSHITKTLLVLSLSGIVAYALTPLVNRLALRMPRGLAITISYLLGFGAVLGLGAILVDTAATQITTLVESLPSYSHQLQRYEPQIVSALRPFGVTSAKIQSTQQQVIAYLQGIGTTAAKDSVGIVSGIVSTSG